ncbi:MAG: TraR/DksA C4-type zinc finger protein [Balneolaceae bacterium]|nr:TraR/DksA C4-type zinc finger protein [Balneolaceae bacterium]MBO6545359.1 TraR/DksA C4-type zinc finger protein [Balneolaceae bacterium]MBO6646755.1 TraR/DksA C4-type zinc finger protein [Balneolaceae bacterium]
MTSSEKKHLKTIILDKISSLKQEITELTELTKPIPLDAAIGRISRMDAINNKTINEASLRDKKKVLKRLERIYENSDSKEFGLCLKCGKEIPFGRLEYMPQASRCVDCMK